MAWSHVWSALGGAAAGMVVGRLSGEGAGQLARLGGSTLATPTAAPWVTDFLNASYYAKPSDRRDLDDLRLAFAVLTTAWHRHGTGRLGAADVLAFHRAFGTARFAGTGGRTGTLDRAHLEAGAAELLGDWFPEAARDWDRTGWGIVFPTVADKQAHDPEVRLARAKLGPLTPPTAPPAQQVWHTYPPVEVPDAEATVDALLAVEHWPDYASELGRFTPLRDRGLDGQTFEIEVVGFPSPRTPVFIRAYVTIDNLVTAADPAARDAWVDDVRAGFAARPDELDPLPEGAELLAGFDLVCHEGHFMGNAKNRLLLYRADGRTWVRAGGSWDPMTWHLSEMYDRVGRWSQHAFWGMEAPRQSMLHQLAAQVSRRTAVEAPS
ncbi:hypothetical protein [Salsipaludibacter albus]|uniref:hypothetical protein n=1 Tax=Salsipaludibacter albus TaxID=2849650 RepID=UPI001EE40FAE|nr:hypothetical protein [Salsipaludibacter albus]MBY5163888.1 hypothetical protein [Salsipaludibacter albus]